MCLWWYYEIKIFRKFSRKLSFIFKANIKNIRFVLQFKGLPKFILNNLNFLLILLFYFNYENLLNSKDFFTTISIFLFAALRLIPSLSKIIFSFNSIKFSKLAVENIQNELSDKNYISKENLKELSKNFISLEIKDLDVVYKDRNKPVINNLNLKINNGQKVLIVGETVSGKHISRYSNCIKKSQKGEIWINGDLKVENIFSYVSYVPQNVFLFDDTILNNIIFMKIIQITISLKEF